MEIEYKEIPQRQYLINNIPAGKFGEWPGIKPNHWRGSIKIIRPVQFNRILDDGVYQIEKNRKHFKEKYGFEKPYKNQKRLFSAINFKYEDKKEGLKPIKFIPTPIKTAFDRKHFPQKQGIEKIPFYKGIRTYYPNGQCRSLKEMTLEKQMGGKKRVLSIEDQRNGMKMRVPGDKYYRTSEQFPTYYKEGGLIPGSTNSINYNKTQSRKAYNFYETLDLTKRVLDRNKLWDNKCKKEDFDFDKNYVEKIILNWEKNILNDFDPNYSKKKNEVVEPENFRKVPPRAQKGNANKGKGKK